MFGLTALPSLLFLIGMCFVPESPRWLAKNGQPDSARGVLKQIGAAPYADAAIAEIESTLASEEIQHVRFADLLEPKMRKVLVLGVVLAVFHQWCGINVIFNYAEEIFKAAGYDISSVLNVTALWIACFILTYTFPLLNGTLGSSGTFWLYAVICVAGFLFILLKLPETKGKTLEQIERELVDRPI